MPSSLPWMRKAPAFPTQSGCSLLCLSWRSSRRSTLLTPGSSLAKPSFGTAVKYNSQQILDIVFILRVLRLIRIVDSIQRFRVIMNTLINIVPTTLTFGGLTLVVSCVFAVIGMELFHGKIQYFPASSNTPHALECGNPALKDSLFARGKYCKNNDLASSFIVLMELTVVNQWHVFANGFANVTAQPAKLYFIAFHIVMVIIIVNIFVSFILEAFFVEYSLEKSEVETAMEQKIQELGMGVQEDELRDEQLLDNMESAEHELEGEGGTKAQSKGLLFKIASKPKCDPPGCPGPRVPALPWEKLPSPAAPSGL